jgi:hypothetical protein
VSVLEAIFYGALCCADFEKGLYYVDTESDPPVLYLNKLASSPLIKIFQTQGHGHAKALLAAALGVTSDYLMDEKDQKKETAQDLAFYRKYRTVDPATKDKVRQMLDLMIKK